MKNKMYNKIQITYCSGSWQGHSKAGLVFLVLEYGIGYFKGLRNLETISTEADNQKDKCPSCWPLIGQAE